MRSLIFALILTPAVALADGNPQIDRLWRGKCASCHGADGKAQTEQGKKMTIRDLSTAEWQKIGDDQIKAAINNGVSTVKNGVQQQMEGYKTSLRADQIDGLVALIRGLKK